MDCFLSVNNPFNKLNSNNNNNNIDNNNNNIDNKFSNKNMDFGRNSESNNDGKIFIGGLCWQTTTETLRKYFGQYGEVSDCTIMRDMVTKRSRGFGFVNFCNRESVEKVLKDAPHTIDEKLVDAKVAVPRPKGGSASTKSLTKSRKIFVGGLSAPTTSEDIRKYFEKFGPVGEAVLMIDKQTHRHRGFGFVTFDNDESAENVCSRPFHEINNKMVECKRALPKEVMATQTTNKNLISVSLPATFLTSSGRNYALPGYYYHADLGGYTLIPAAAINNQDRFLATSQMPGNGYLTSGDLVQTLVMQPPNQLSITNGDVSSSNELVPRNAMQQQQQQQYFIPRSLQRPPQSLPTMHNPISTLPVHTPHTILPHNLSSRQVFSLFDCPHDIIIGVPVSNGYQLGSPTYLTNSPPNHSPTPAVIHSNNINTPGQIMTPVFQDGLN